MLAGNTQENIPSVTQVIETPKGILSILFENRMTILIGLLVFVILYLLYKYLFASVVPPPEEEKKKPNKVIVKPISNFEGVELEPIKTTFDVIPEEDEEEQNEEIIKEDVKKQKEVVVPQEEELQPIEEIPEESE